MVTNGGKHLASSTALLYVSRKNGGRGLQSVEGEYKITKIKAAMKLFSNSDPSMKMVREFEERSAVLGYQSLIIEALRYSEELGLTLRLAYPEPTVCEGCWRGGDYDKVKATAEIEVRRTVVEDST